jgi:D-alanine-D-alanine ligase-like ATP-grasp enzyme
MQNKYLAGRFLRKHGFPVPPQQLFTKVNQALDFLEQHGPIVVKPCSQWGARGVSTNITGPDDLKAALRKARRFEPDILLEKMVGGEDYRLVFINYSFVCALQRRPACIRGNGRDTIRRLIAAQNKQCTAIDPVNRIPLDSETGRFLNTCRLSYDSIPENGQQITVRQTANYHTGGTVHDVSSTVSPELITLGGRIVKQAGLPVAGIDFVHSEEAQQTHVIELAPDLAISPRGGQRIARHFIDYLFPQTKDTAHTAD